MFPWHASDWLSHLSNRPGTRLPQYLICLVHDEGKVGHCPNYKTLRHATRVPSGTSLESKCVGSPSRPKPSDMLVSLISWEACVLNKLQSRVLEAKWGTALRTNMSLMGQSRQVKGTSRQALRALGGAKLEKDHPSHTCPKRVRTVSQTCPISKHVPHMSHTYIYIYTSHTCPTHVPHMSHTCPKHVPNMSQACPFSASRFGLIQIRSPNHPNPSPRLRPRERSRTWRCDGGRGSVWDINQAKSTHPTAKVLRLLRRQQTIIHHGK